MNKVAASFKFSNGASLKNRIVLAPMTTSQSHEDGSLSEAELYWLELRAQGGFGMLISCASHVQPDAKAWTGQLGCFSDSHLPGLKRLAELGKKNGALTILQLFHGGVRSPKALTGVQPTAPSAVELNFPNFEMPRALEGAEIEKIIKNFVTAAVRAQVAGLSGVEVHGANGYLFTQFLSQINNRRTDRWGGSLENRARFLTDTVKRIRAKVRSDFIVGVRLLAEDALNQKGFTIDEMLKVSHWLGELGIDYLHISAESTAVISWSYAGDKTTNLRRFRDVLDKKVALLACGGITTMEQAELALGEGADLVALGKTAISTPDWPIQAQQPGFKPRPFPLTYAEAQSVGVSMLFAKVLEHFKLVRAE